jgi:hypothetical protein
MIRRTKDYAMTKKRDMQWSIIQEDKFRYTKLSIIRRMTNNVATTTDQNTSQKTKY